jgi:hypothetical protein
MYFLQPSTGPTHFKTTGILLKTVYQKNQTELNLTPGTAETFMEHFFVRKRAQRMHKKMRSKSFLLVLLVRWA